MKQSAVVETIFGFLGISPERNAFSCDLVRAVMNEALRAVIDGRLFPTTRVLNSVLFAAGEVALANRVLEHTDAIIALRPDPAEAQRAALPVQVVAGPGLDDEAAERVRTFVESEMSGASYARRVAFDDTLDADALKGIDIGVNQAADAIPAAGPGERVEIKKGTAE